MAPGNQLLTPRLLTAEDSTVAMDPHKSEPPTLPIAPAQGLVGPRIRMSRCH